MLVSVVGNWLFGIVLGLANPQIYRRALLVCNLILNLALLGFFKYEGFLADNINVLLGLQIVPNLEPALPIGISFYTLQAVSYVIDVYRGDVTPQRNIIYLGMYIACFPQLVAGPIVRYSTIQDQMENRRENLEDFSAGLRLFVIGLAKKVLLANVVAVLADRMLVLGGPSIGVIGAWAGLLAYTFQICFDFSGRLACEDATLGAQYCCCVGYHGPMARCCLELCRMGRVLWSITGVREACVGPYLSQIAGCGAAPLRHSRFYVWLAHFLDNRHG